MENGKKRAVTPHIEAGASRQLTPSLTGREAELAALQKLIESVSLVCVCGVAGVGKSSLVRHVARTTSSKVLITELGRGDFDALLEDGRRALGCKGPAQGDPLADLLGLIEGQGVVWILEDLHVLPTDTRRAIASRATASLSKARCIATTRERLIPDPSSAPWGELLLTGLDENAAAEVWRELDRLQKPLGKFEEAWLRSRGNPLLLRCYHAGFLNDDPVAEWVAALSRDERRLMGSLALCELPLPLAVLESLVEPEGGTRLVRTLVSRMLIHVDDSLLCRIHDLFRDAVLAQLSNEARGELHQLLIDGLREPEGIEPALRAREIARHLGAIGRSDEGMAYLVRRGTEIDRLTAAATLSRTYEVTLRNDGLCDAVDIDWGDVLVKCEKATHDRDLGLDFTQVFAELQMFRGQPEQGLKTLEELLRSSNLSIGLRLRSLIALGVGLAAAGRFDEVDLWLAPEMKADCPRARATAAMVRAYCAWFAGRDQDAYEFSGAAISTLSMLRSYRLGVVIPGLHAVITSRLGHANEATRALTQMRRAVHRVSDPLLGTYARYFKALTLAHQGRLAEAESNLRDLLVLARTSGFKFGVLACSGALGWLLLQQGETARGRAALAEMQTAARASGYHGLVVHAERLLLDDPVRQLECPPVTPLGEQRSVRSLVVEALHAGRSGDAHAVEALSTRVEETECDAFERACCEVARGLVGLVAGDRCSLVAAADHFARARAILIKEGRADGIIDELLGRLAAIRAASSTGVELLGSEPILEGLVVIDERRVELRYSDVAIDLHARPVLKGLLLALGRHLGQVVDRSELMWMAAHRAYAPDVDDGALKANVSHLRKWLAPAGLTIEAIEGGYRLNAPPRTLHICVPLDELKVTSSALRRPVHARAQESA